MFPIFNRNFAFFGAPLMGFGFGAPRVIVEPAPRPMYCGNPFMSFRVDFMGGMGMAAACGWGNSYASYPNFSPSVFSSYQTYPSYPVSSPYGFNFMGGFDFTDVALNNVFSKLIMNPFSVQPNMSAPTTWSSTPFSSLTQYARPQYQMPAGTPTRAQSQTSAPSRNYQPQNNTAASVNNTAAPVNNNVPVAQPQQTNSVTTAAPVNQTVAQEAPVVHETIPVPTKAIRTQSLVPFKQKYDQLVANLDATVDRDKLKNDVLDYTRTNAMTDVFNAIEALDNKGSEPDDSEKALLNEKLDKFADAVAKCQNKYPVDNTPPKTEAQLKADGDTFNATCKGGDCGDYSDRLHYSTDKREWEKSIKLGYPKQPIAPESTLVEVPNQYLIDKSGSKYFANPEALKHFIEMSEVCSSQRGIQLAVRSSYRNLKDQEKEFEADKERLRKANEAWDSLTTEEQKKVHKPLPKAAPPGYSEHHTGYPFDIGDASPIDFRNDGDFLTDKNGEFVIDKKTGKRIPVSAHSKWLEKNAKIFGFEMSYPPDNNLGVLQEGWHYRFNPELCEKYKTKREELVKKYIAGPQETVNADNI